MGHIDFTNEEIWAVRDQGLLSGDVYELLRRNGWTVDDDAAWEAAGDEGRGVDAITLQSNAIAFSPARATPFLSIQTINTPSPLTRHHSPLEPHPWAFDPHRPLLHPTPLTLTQLATSSHTAQGASQFNHSRGHRHHVLATQRRSTHLGQSQPSCLCQARRRSRCHRQVYGRNRLAASPPSSLGLCTKLVPSRGRRRRARQRCAVPRPREPARNPQCRVAPRAYGRRSAPPRLAWLPQPRRSCHAQG